MARSLLPIIVFAQFAGTSLWFAGNAVLAGQPGFSPASLTASVQLGFIGGTLVFTLMALADRWPASRLFLACSLLGAAANALIPVFLDKPSLVLTLRLVTGFFLAGIYPVGMKIAADEYPAGLGKALGWLVGALVLGTAFPHLLRGQMAHLPAGPLFWLISALAVSGGLLLVIMVPGKRSGGRVRLVLKGSLQSIFQTKAFRSPAFGYLGHMWELYTFWAFVPLLLQAHASFAENKSSSPGVYAFGVIAMGALGCVLGGLWAIRVGSRMVAVWALRVSASCCLLLPLAVHLPLFLYFCFLLLWGLAVVADSPQLSALAAQTAPPHLKGTALTLLTCVGFALTIVSLLFIQYLAAHLAQPYLALAALAPGPVAGILALRKCA